MFFSKMFNRLKFTPFFLTFKKNNSKTINYKIILSLPLHRFPSSLFILHSFLLLYLIIKLSNTSFLNNLRYLTITSLFYLQFSLPPFLLLLLPLLLLPLPLPPNHRAGGASQSRRLPSISRFLISLSATNRFCSNYISLPQFSSVQFSSVQFSSVQFSSSIPFIHPLYPSTLLLHILRCFFSESALNITCTVASHVLSSQCLDDSD